MKEFWIYAISIYLILGFIGTLWVRLRENRAEKSAVWEYLLIIPIMPIPTVCYFFWWILTRKF